MDSPKYINLETLFVRPIVSVYCTPLSSLHKQLSIILKPLTISPLRLKNSLDFVNHLKTDTDPNFSFFCSLDVKSLYTNCDMRQSAKSALDKFRTNRGPSRNTCYRHRKPGYLLLLLSS